MIKQSLFFLVGIILFAIGYVFAYNYFNSVVITITPKNTESFSVSNDNTNKLIYETASQNTSTIRVPKNSLLTIYYNGSTKYETNSLQINIKSNPKSVTINPYYSEEYLNTLRDKESVAIRNEINAYDPIISEGYSIEDIKLYHFGEWASAKLIWNGDYGQNTDTQRIILKKTNNKWTIPNPPSILYFYKNTPNIPIDILRNVNES